MTRLEAMKLEAAAKSVADSLWQRRLLTPRKITFRFSEATEIYQSLLKKDAADVASVDHESTQVNL